MSFIFRPNTIIFIFTGVKMHIFKQRDNICTLVVQNKGFFLQKNWIAWLRKMKLFSPADEVLLYKRPENDFFSQRSNSFFFSWHRTHKSILSIERYLTCTTNIPGSVGPKLQIMLQIMFPTNFTYIRREDSAAEVLDSLSKLKVF